MPDIPLTALLKTGQVQGIQPGSVTGNATPLPQGIADLPPGTIVTGFVLNRDASNNPIIRTDVGDVQLESNLFLKIGSEVVIRVDAAGANARARILTVDGQSVLGIQGQASPRLGPDVVSASGQIPAASTLAETLVDTDAALPVQAQGSALTGAVLRGIVVPGTPLPEAGGQQPSPGPAPLPSGTLLQLRVVRAEPVPESSLRQAGVAISQPPTAPLRPEGIPLPQITALLYNAYARVSGKPLPDGIPSFYAAPVAQEETPAVLAYARAPASVQTPVQAQGVAARPVPVQAVQIFPDLPPQTVAPQPASPAAANAPGTASSVDVAPATVNPGTAAAVPQTPAPSPVQQNATASVSSDPSPKAFPAGQDSTFSAPYTPSAPVAGTRFAGTVVGTEKSGEPVLHTPYGTVKLPPQTGLPPGTKLTVELVSVDKPLPRPVPVSSMEAETLPVRAAVSELATGWDTLQEAVGLLARQNDTQAAAFLRSAMPVLPLPQGAAAPNLPVPPSFSAGLFLFLAALKGGDFKTWLGQRNVDMLQQLGRADLIDQGNAEFSLMRSLALPPATPQPQHWQAYFFPVAVGQDIVQNRLFVKRDKREQGKGKSQEGTRFILEVDLTALGDLQFDGYVRKQEGSVQFDLIMRSHMPLPRDMQDDIVDIWKQSSEITGTRGTVQFQHAREFPVHPLQELLTQTPGSIVA